MNLSNVVDANCRFTLTDVGSHGDEKIAAFLVTQVLEKRLVLVT